MTTLVPVVVPILVVLGVAAVLSATPLGQRVWTPDEVRQLIRSFGSWAPVIYMVFYSVRPFVLLPAGLLTVVSGLVFGPLWGTIYTVIGATVCAAWEFIVARRYGRRAVASVLRGRAVAIDQRVGEQGFKTVLLIRLIPNVPYDVQNYSLGLTQISFRDYIVATALGMIPASLLAATIGHSLKEWRQLWLVVAVLLMLAGIYLAIQWYRSRLASHQTSADSARDLHEDGSDSADEKMRL